MVLAYDNLLKTATMTASSEDASYPISNVYHKWKRHVYKSVDTVTSSVITITFNEAKVINSFYMLYTNVDNVSCVLKDSSGGTLATWTTNPTNGTVSDVYSAEITVSAPDTIYIGAMFLGSSISNDKTAEQDIPLDSSDVPTFSSDSQVSGRKGSVTRSGKITIPDLSYTQRQALEEAFYECSNIVPFFLDLWEDTPLAFEPLYGVFASGLEITHHPEDGDTIAFSFREVN